MSATYSDTTRKIKSFKLGEAEWPRGVKAGSIVVKIYRRERADGSDGFEVADYSNGKRRLRSCANEQAALVEAERIAKLMASGDVEAAMMGNREAASYGRAIELLRPTGIALEIVASHFADAFKILGADKIVAAAEFFKRHAADTIIPRTVPEVVAELIASREKKGRAENTVSDLRARLNKFADKFACEIANVTTADVQGWLDGLKVEERTRLNYRAKVSQLFNFAEQRGFIIKGANPVAHTEKPQPSEGEIQIYTPTEIHRLLDAASDDFQPCIALGAFAGLRSAEIQRLDWKDIDFAKGQITASAKKRGTPSRRFVPMSDNLRAWLQPNAKRSGLVWKPKENNRKLAEDWFSDAQTATSAATADEKKKLKPVEWKYNALRHSWISYRVDEVQNVNQVALEAGNSPATIHKHYRELVPKGDAAKWFAVAPKGTAGKIIQLTATKG